MTSNEIVSNFSNSLDFLRCAQLGAYVYKIPERFSDIRDLTTFERICLDGKSMRHLLSHSYSLLIRANVPQDLSFNNGKGIYKPTSLKLKKDRILLFAHKSSMMSKYQEGGYKLLTRWYQTPSLFLRCLLALLVIRGHPISHFLGMSAVE